MNGLSRRLIGGIAVVASAAMLAIPTAALAKGPGGGGGKGGGGETAVNNLSVPAIFVPDAASFPTLTCPGGPTDPIGTTAVYDGVTYFIQGKATWQAQCGIAPAGDLAVAAEWGDNLTGAPLKAGTPIRVEMAFTYAPTTGPMTGYTVVNLTPTLADRNSTYGTTGAQVSFSTVRVWAAGTTFSIRNANGTYVVAPGTPATAEINATGAVVYGYNWGSGKGAKSTVTAGTYTITFVARDVTFSSTDAGQVIDPHTVSLTVTVGAKSHGGHR